MSTAEATINLNVTIDPTALTPEDAAKYATQLLASLTQELNSTAPSNTSSPAPGHILGLDKMLGRLADQNPTKAHLIKQVHETLCAQGYTPRLPDSSKPNPPSYISYIDGNGDNLGNLNSASFTVMRGPLRDTIAEREHFTAAGRYAVAKIVNEATVESITKLGADYSV